jgi:molybdate transport system substrate-binding protein
MFRATKAAFPLSLLSFLGVVAIATTLLLSACGDGDRVEIIVGAASSLEPLFRDLEAPFEAAHDVDVVFTYAASGTLAQQIHQGAPIDVYASADAAFADALLSEGLLDEAGVRVFGQGKLVIVIAHDAPFLPSRESESAFMFRFEDVERLAIANPEIAPYGAAAKQFLERSGQWEALQANIVYGANATQAFQFVAAGNADAGIVPESLVIDQGTDDIIAIPLPGAGEPLEQTVAVVEASPNQRAAAQFVEFLLGPEAQPALERLSYHIPGRTNAVER